MVRSHARLDDLLLDRDGAGAISGSADGIRRILVLDGGVSTHLESLLALYARVEDRHSESISTIRPAFPHRELWSSSLLLTDQGRRTIHQGHLDWILAGADILSTVTYQCHYNRSHWSDALQNCVTSDAMDEMWYFSRSRSGGARLQLLRASSLRCCQLGLLRSFLGERSRVHG
jgi:Homocysteine S-methyltransferase